MTCLVLATEGLTMNVACDLQLACSFSRPVNVDLCLTPTFWGQEYFKQLEIKHRRFQYPLALLPVLFCFIIFMSSYSLLVFKNPNAPTLMSSIIVEAYQPQGLPNDPFTGIPSDHRKTQILTLRCITESNLQL